MPDHGGPVPYSEAVPCTPANPQLDLFIPAAVLQGLSEESRVRIAAIQVEFAQRVSRALARSYGEIAMILGKEAAPDRPRVQSLPSA